MTYMMKNIIIAWFTKSSSEVVVRDNLFKFFFVVDDMYGSDVTSWFGREKKVEKEKYTLTFV